MNITRFLEAISYPDIPSPEPTSTTIKVDGHDIRLTETQGRIILEATIIHPDTPDAIRTFSAYAMGRILKEEATLAWNPETEDLILWQDIPSTAPTPLLRRTFEVFATSCDWWYARASESSDTSLRLPDLFIIP